MKTKFEAIRDEILAWEGSATRPGRFGSTVFRVRGHEIGHVHPNSHADLPFPRKVRDELVASGRAEPHYFLPKTGWVTIPLSGEDAVERTLDLFRLNYDLITQKRQYTEAKEEG